MTTAKRLFVAEIYADDAEAIKRFIAGLNANHARNAKQREYRARRAAAREITNMYFTRQANESQLSAMTGLSQPSISRVISGLTAAPRCKRFLIAAGAP